MTLARAPAYRLVHGCSGLPGSDHISVILAVLVGCVAVCQRVHRHHRVWFAAALAH